MRGTLMVATLLVAGATLTPAPSNAAGPPQPPMTSAVSGKSLVEQVQYGRRCGYWRRTCRFRWGFGWRYRRCLRRHGC